MTKIIIKSLLFSPIHILSSVQKMLPAELWPYIFRYLKMTDLKHLLLTTRRHYAIGRKYLNSRLITTLRTMVKRAKATRRFGPIFTGRVAFHEFFWLMGPSSGNYHFNNDDFLIQKGCLMPVNHPMSVHIPWRWTEIGVGQMTTNGKTRWIASTRGHDLLRAVRITGEGIHAFEWLMGEETIFKTHHLAAPSVLHELPIWIVHSSWATMRLHADRIDSVHLLNGLVNSPERARLLS